MQLHFGHDRWCAQDRIRADESFAAFVIRHRHQTRAIMPSNKAAAMSAPASRLALNIFRQSKGGSISSEDTCQYKWAAGASIASAKIMPSPAAQPPASISTKAIV